MSPKNGAGYFAQSRLRRGCPRKNGAGCFAQSRLRRGCPRKTGQAASLHIHSFSHSIPAYGEDVPEKRGRLLRSIPPTARMSPKNGAGCFAPHSFIQSFISRLRRGCPRKTGQAASLNPAYGEDVPSLHIHSFNHSVPAVAGCPRRVGAGSSAQHSVIVSNRILKRLPQVYFL